jgi:hypothetical protein
MSPEEARAILSPTHRMAIKTAFLILERPDFAARLGDMAGRPVGQVLKMTPRAVEARLSLAVEAALRQALGVAIRSLGDQRARKSASFALAGASGAVGGFLGAGALAVELPVTTTLILRAIAEVARRHGEDLSRLDARMDCVSVLGLAARPSGQGPDVGYFAVRTAFSRLVADATARLIERGAAAASAPAMSAMVTAIAPRFGLVVSERAAASALPVVGALGGATLNMLFVRHFQRAAHGHFTIRRLERQYGPEVVRAYYGGLVLKTAPLRRARQ